MRWWQFGLIGGVGLLLATTIKAVGVVVWGAAEAVDRGEAAGVAAFIFGSGFICGVVAWAGLGLSRRFGPAGDAVVGLVVMVVYFVSCMLWFEPEMLGSKFVQGGLPMLGLAVPFGLFLGWYIGRDFRPWRTAEQRRRQRSLDETEDEGSSPLERRR